MGTFDNHGSSQGLRFRRLPGGRGSFANVVHGLAPASCRAWGAADADGSSRVVRVLVPQIRGGMIPGFARGVPQYLGGFPWTSML